MRNVNEQYKGGGANGSYASFDQDGRPRAWVHPDPYRPGRGYQVRSASAEPGKKVVTVKVQNQEGNTKVRRLGGWTDDYEISNAAFAMSRPEITDIVPRQLEETDFFQSHYFAYKDRLMTLYTQRRKMSEDNPIALAFVTRHSRDFLDRIYQERGIKLFS